MPARWRIECRGIRESSPMLNLSHLECSRISSCPMGRIWMPKMGYGLPRLTACGSGHSFSMSAKAIPSISYGFVERGFSRHRHAGPVHAFTLRGRWRYLEHDWEAVPGSYAFEPPGATHPLVVPDDVDDIITLFHVNGGYVYVDPQGLAEGCEDVFTKLEAAGSYCAAAGIDPAMIARITR